MARTRKSQRTGRGVDGRPGRRYELTDAGYERIASLLPAQHRGGKWARRRTVLNGMFRVLNSGGRRRDMPERYGKWETVYGRWRRWAPEGLFDRIIERAGAPLGGVPLGALVTAGQAHESKSFEALMNAVRVRGDHGRRRPDAVAGDRGYSCPRIRAWLPRRGIEAVIPSRSDQPRERFSRSKYRRRNVVERCIGWLKECRRIATRYEKPACHYLAMVKPAMIQRCLRLLDPSNRA